MPAAEGRKKWTLSWLAPFYLPPASIGLRTFRGPSANAGWAVWRIDSRNVRQPSSLETLQRKRLEYLPLPLTPLLANATFGSIGRCEESAIA